MNILYLTLPGQPIAEARTRRGAHGQWYNPQQKQMDAAKRIIKEQLPEGFIMIPKGVPVTVNCVWFFAPSETEKKRKGFIERIAGEDFPYLKKCDRDNADKFVLDRMSKMIFFDDAQVFKGTLEKYYSINPRTEIEIIY